MVLNPCRTIESPGKFFKKTNFLQNGKILMEGNLAISSTYLLVHKSQFSKSRKHWENMNMLLTAEICVIIKTGIIKCPWVEDLKNKIIEYYAAIKRNGDYFYILIWNTLWDILTSEEKSRWGNCIVHYHLPYIVSMNTYGIIINKLKKSTYVRMYRVVGTRRQAIFC